MEDEVDSFFDTNSVADQLDTLTIQELESYIQQTPHLSITKSENANSSINNSGGNSNNSLQNKVKTDPHDSYLNSATYLTPNNSYNNLVQLEQAKSEPTVNFEIYEQVEFEDQDSDSEEDKPLHKQTQIQPGQKHRRNPSEIEDYWKLLGLENDMNPHTLDLSNLRASVGSAPSSIKLPPITTQKPIIVTNSPITSTNTTSALAASGSFRPGHSRNASTSSIGSATGDDESERSSGYSSTDTDEVDSFSFPGLKKYRQPITMRGLNLTIGGWSLKESLPNEEWISFEVKFLFGRRKIKYEIGSRSKSKANLVIEYTFSQICGLDVTPEKRLIVIELSEPPSFTSKERGKYNKISDFTEGNASTYPRHHIEVLTGNFDEFLERLRTCDKRLRQLARQGLPASESAFPQSVIERAATVISSPAVQCDWDNESNAVVHCEDCNANYCSVCDDVLHRNANKKGHSRVPLDVDSSQKSKKNKKRKKSDRCRCGTGATKGTLGEPCTGNRCPCFSNGRSCDACGCKNCANPIKKKNSPHSPATPGSDSSPIVVPSGIPMIPVVSHLSSSPTTTTTTTTTTTSTSSSNFMRQSRSVSM